MKIDYNQFKLLSNEVAFDLLKKNNISLNKKDDELIVLSNLIFSSIENNLEKSGDFSKDCINKLKKYGIKDVINFYFEKEDLVKYQKILKKYNLPIDTVHIASAVEKDKTAFINYYLTLDSKIKNDLFAETIYQKKEAWQIYMIKNNFEPSPALISSLKDQDDLNKALRFKSIFDLQNKMNNDLDPKNIIKAHKI